MTQHTEKPTPLCAKRPRYFKRQLLTEQLMSTEQAYHRDRRWLLSRAVLGPGVVIGFGIGNADEDGTSGGEGCLGVGPGLALDAHGREIVWPGGTLCPVDIVTPNSPAPGIYTLLAHYAERPSPEASDPCGIQQPSWICEEVVFTLSHGCCPDDPCRCPDLDDQDCLDECSYLCVRQDSDEAAGAAVSRPTTPCRTDDGRWYDPKAGLPLACVEVWKRDGDDRCDIDWMLRLTEPDPCRVRRHIPRNQQLLELIRGCHIRRPMVTRLSWIESPGLALATMSWEEFVQRCNATDESGDAGFAVHLSQPVRVEGLHPGTVILRAVTQEERTDYWEEGRVPLAEIRPLDADDGYASGFQLLFTQDWLYAEVNGTRSTLFGGALIELLVRGAFLRDRCGQMLDARPLDVPRDRPEYTRPGDDFVALVRVQPRDYRASAA
jgi:hypothetical protein